MAKENIRIKDIAERAGVSVGTVDRVLHNRPNVSKKALDKVNKALQEMDYKPNMYASALAYNKSYTFYCLLPKHESEAYWEEIEEGAVDSCDHRRDFGISVQFIYYNRFDVKTFEKATADCMKQKPSGVIIVPSTLEVTRKFTDQLHAQQIPFILLDSYMPDLRPLSFYGQDSFQSGYFAARMLMLIASKEKEIMLMKQMRNGNVASKQQENRETGFRHYMRDHFPDVTITTLDLPLDEQRENYDDILETFFSTHPQVHHCITFNSKAHLVGEFLSRSNRRDIQIMGYDMVPKNEVCVKDGSISFLIAQHAYRQGYSCIESLFEAIVLKKKVNPVNYMPIEILTKENVDFYRRTFKG
jgi:LacI family transcriptional regulator